MRRIPRTAARACRPNRRESSPDSGGRTREIPRCHDTPTRAPSSATSIPSGDEVVMVSARKNDDPASIAEAKRREGPSAGRHIELALDLARRIRNGSSPPLTTASGAFQAPAYSKRSRAASSTSPVSPNASSPSMTVARRAASRADRAHGVDRAGRMQRRQPQHRRLEQVEPALHCDALAFSRRRALKHQFFLMLCQISAAWTRLVVSTPC